MPSMEDQELQKIREIRRHIVASLNTGVVLAGEEQDIYLAERLSLISQSKKLWCWRLMLEPMDGDFLNLAYRAVLRREPDPQSWNHFHARLAAGTASRTDVLMALVDSIEFRETRPDWLGDGKDSLLLLHLVNRSLRKVQLFSRVGHLIWMLATGFQRKKRHESIMKEIQDELNEVKEREMYMVEYLHNQERRRKNMA